MFGIMKFFELYLRRYMLGIGGVPAVIMLLGMLFMPESPRHLVNMGNFKHLFDSVSWKNVFSQ